MKPLSKSIICGLSKFIKYIYSHRFKKSNGIFCFAPDCPLIVYKIDESHKAKGEVVMNPISKRLLGAIDAFKRKDEGTSKRLHAPDEIRNALERHKTESGAYLGEMVYGALDGIVTTFAVVAGVQGAGLSSGVVLILGFANLIGDGLSMGVGGYLSKKSQKEFARSERKRETWEIENYPAGEKEEIKEIYRKKGFSGADLDRAVEIISSDRENWVNIMMQEELGIMEENKPPLKSGLLTFISFVIAGFIPLLFFILALAIPGLKQYSFLMSLILTGLTLFGVGSMRVLLTGIRWWRSGLEMLFVGGLAAFGAYLIGYFLQNLA